TPAAIMLGAAEGALLFAAGYVAERPHLRDSQAVRVRLGDLSTQLAGARCALFAAARMWEDERIAPDDAELNSMRAWHLVRQAALATTNSCLEACGARATFSVYPLESALRDVRTFSLQHRDEALMEAVAKPLLGESFSRHDEVEVALQRG